jgi:hypothetical protein
VRTETSIKSQLDAGTLQGLNACHRWAARWRTKTGKATVPKAPWGEGSTRDAYLLLYHLSACDPYSDLVRNAAAKAPARPSEPDLHFEQDIQVICGH